jgi:hypothetical protein
MKKISLRLPDAEYEKVESLRGNNTMPEFIRILISGYHDAAQITPEYFEKLFREVRSMNDTVSRFIAKQEGNL